MDSKELVLRIIQLQPSLSRYRIAKYIYLFDLACIQLYGEPKSGINFKWKDHGPYSETIVLMTKELEKEKKIKINFLQNYYQDRSCYNHIAVEENTPDYGTNAEKILEYILEKFGKMKKDQLEKYVYNTPPMKKAVSEKLRGVGLDMEEAKKIPPYLNDPEFFLLNLEASKKGKPVYKDASEVMQRLMESCNA